MGVVEGEPIPMSYLDSVEVDEDGDLNVVVQDEDMVAAVIITAPVLRALREAVREGPAKKDGEWLNEAIQLPASVGGGLRSIQWFDGWCMDFDFELKDPGVALVSLGFRLSLLDILTMVWTLKPVP